MESLSIQFQPFFEWLLRTTLQASLLICLILLLQAVLRSRLGVRWHYCLWLLLLVRMAMPWTPESRVSLFNLLPQSIPQRQLEHAKGQIADDSADSIAASANTSESTQVSTTAAAQDSREVVTVTPQIRNETKGQLKSAFFELADILPLVWLAGGLVLGTYVCASNFNLLRIVRLRRPLTDQKILDLLEDCKSQMGIRTILGIVTTDKVKSPALFGFVRPRLLLPEGMIEALSREELRYILLHELAHLKRHDIYIGWLISLLQVLHWFNPFVWLAFYRMRSDRELACDALVLARTQSDEPKSYGRIIVNLVERFSRPQRLPGMAGILETKAHLKRRITMIAQFKKNSYQWSPLAVILIIILASVSLPDARHTKASETAPSKTANQPKFTKIRIPNRISWDAQLTPDGKSITFVNDKRLWIMPRSSRLGQGYPGAPRPLDTAGVEVDWCGFTCSANGQWIAFNGEKVKEGYQRIYIVSADGGEPRQVHENNRGGRAINYQLSLSPNGETLAFTSVDANEIHIYTMSIDGSSTKQLVDAQAREPVFSPDGKMIAYVEDKDLGRGGGGLWIVPADGGTPALVAEAGKASSPVWSPDGKMIAFLDYRSDNKIFIVPIAEDGAPAGPKTAIDCCPHEVSRLAGWTRDNEIGAIFDSQQEFALYTQPIQGGKATFVTHGGYPVQPRWSPDGKRIIHVNNTSEASGDWQGHAIAYVSAEGGDVTTVPLHSEPKIRLQGYGTGNHISPDGKTIVFAGHKARAPIPTMYIWTLPIDGGASRQLTSVPLPFRDWYPCWSPDGRNIAFVRMKVPENWSGTRKGNIHIISADGGESRQITSESDRVFDTGPVLWSPDGKLLAYFSRDKDDATDGKLKVISPDGGEPRAVARVEKISPNNEMAWSPDSKRIAYNAAGNKIEIVSLDDGSIVEIEPDLKDVNIYHLDWSPDGESLVFGGYTGGGVEFWMMENFLPTALASADK